MKTRNIERVAVCCICGRVWDAMDPGVQYRSLDLKWWCTDETSCTSTAAANEAATGHRTTSPETLAAMWAALDAADVTYQKMLDEGWRP